jgi:hypothetical protein
MLLTKHTAGQVFTDLPASAADTDSRIIHPQISADFNGRNYHTSIRRLVKKDSRIADIDEINDRYEIFAT